MDDSLTTDVSALDTSEIVTAVKDPNGNTITSVRDSNGTVLEASRNAVARVESLETTLNSYISADDSPPAIKLAAISGACATSSSDIISTTDNVSNSIQYSLDDIVYQPIRPLLFL